MQRLVLGCGAVASSVTTALRGRSGGVLVLGGDEKRIERLRDEGIDARNVDVTDPAVIRTVAGAVDSVVVAEDDPRRSLDATRAVRLAYPDAYVLAHLGVDVTADHRGAIEAHADRVIEANEATTDHLLQRVGDGGIRVRTLRRILRTLDGPLAVVTHDNPDPDAIAAGIALQHIARDAGNDAEVCYYGEINHQENRALVNVLGFELRNLSREDDLSSYGGFALVDHSRAGINDGLPEGTPIDIVVDHHPPRAPIEARFVDLRSDVGSTSTLLTGYLTFLGIELTPALATGLLYGILTDTDSFSREASPVDFEAAAQLLDHVDADALRRIESPSVTAETLDVVGLGISNRRVEDGVLTTCVGRIGDRDALAQAADRLLDMENVTTTLVFGYTDEMVYASARARGTDIDLGEVLRDAFEQIGSAGGHANMAGAQLPVGILVDETSDADRGAVIEEVVHERFLETLGIEPDHAAASVYADFLGTDVHGERG